MNNSNFTVTKLSEDDNKLSANQEKEANVIKLNEKMAVSPKIKKYKAIYLYPTTLILCLFISMLFNNPELGFLIIAPSSFILVYLYILSYYEALSFLVTDRSITIYWGIFNKKSKTVLFDTVQTIDSKSGYIMSALGILNFRISITIPSQINLNQYSIKRTPDLTVVLTPGQADWLTEFIIKIKNK